MAKYDKMTKAELIEELKEKERQFSSALELVSSSDDAIIGKSLDGTISSWNRGAENIYGYSAKEIIGQNISILFPPDQQDEVLWILEKISRGERIKNFETVRVTKEGRQINISLNISPIINEAGGFTGASTIARDITECKRAEEELRQSEERLSRAQEIAHLGSWDLDLEKNELSWSDEVCRIFGMQPREFAANYETFLERVHPEDRAAVNEAYSRSVSMGQDKYDIEHRIVKKDSGEIRIVHEKCENIRDESGRIVRSVGMVQDITERKRSENIMQARLRLLEFANTHSMDELLTATLDEIEALTGSKIGFYHFLESDQETLSLQNWSTNTLKNMCTAAAKGSHYDIAQAGVWVECVKVRRPVIHNDYASLPNRKGMPEGHAQVVREVVVPIFRGDMIKAIIGVGNKSNNYNEDDIETVSQLGDLSWDITESKRAEEALRESELRYREVFENSSECIFLLDVTADGRFKFAGFNPAEEKTAGFSNAKMYGKFIEEVIPAELASQVITNYRCCLEAGTIINYDEELDLPLGRRHFHTVLIPVRNIVGEIYRIVGVARDITERKRMEEELRLAHEELEKRVVERTKQLEKTLEALRTSEERYALAVQGSNDGIWDRDFSTGEVYYSPRWKSMLGYEDDEIPNDAEEWKKRIHPDDYRRVMDAFVAYMEGRIPSYEVEYRLRHKDGSYRYILARGICLRDSNGVPYRSSGSHTDITDKKRAEDALMQSERHFRQLVEHSPVAMAVSCDIEEKIILLNRKFTELFGYTQKDIPDVGHWWSLAYPDKKYRRVVKTAWESKVEQAIKNIRTFEPMEAMVTCKDGTIRHIEFNFSFIGERNLITFIDHTEIKSAQEVIRKSEEKYRGLFEKSKDTIFISDPERRIIDMNQAGIALFGYTKEELFSLDLEKLYCNRKDREVLWQKLYRSGFVSDFEVEMKKKAGEKIFILLSMSVIKDDAGQISGYQGIIHDMTDRKKLERQLLQSQKMESVGILAGGVAHDFNNLLTAISGYGQILMESIPEDDEISQESIKIVLTAAERAAELTRGLLAFSRKQVISLKPLHINTVISDTVKLIERIIGEDIALSTNFIDKNLVIKADPGQIEQVLMNLATNSRDAMPHGGHLSITTRQVVVEDGSEKLYDLPSPGKYAMISVTDTGTGVDKKTMESIFEPFYTTKEIGKGTGLGLSIVYGIVKQHGGSVLVSSEPGKGTTFDIYLPVVKGHAVKEESKISTPHTGGTETLLVVEDEEIVRMFMKKILERAGYKVIIADDGENAVARFREHDDISLVLSDLVMPKKDGKEMQYEIRKIKPGIKIMFISGYAADVMQKKGMLEEGTEFITKPFNKNDLLQKVREVLDKD